jgi:hypothetical protein
MPVNFPIVRSRYSIVEIPSYDVTIIRFARRVEQRILNDPDPERIFELNFESLLLSDALLILNFFHARHGNYESFYLQNQGEAYRPAPWQAATTHYAGDIIRPVSPNGRSYRCTTPGTSHAANEPAWPEIYHGTVTDNGLVWTENSRRVRFLEPSARFDNFKFSLYSFGTVQFLEVDG